MSDDKPLRHEEYLATMEENRRLKAENEEMKAKGVKARKERRIHLWEGFKRMRKLGFLIIIIGAALAFGPTIVARVARMDSPEDIEQRKATCFDVAQEANHNAPWDNWYIWAKVNGQGFFGPFTVDRREKELLFKSEEQGIKYVRSWNAILCRPAQQNYPISEP